MPGQAILLRARALTAALALPSVLLGAIPARAEAAPGQAPAPRRLNNLVTELLDAKFPEATKVPPEGLKFLNPQEGWVFFRAKASAGAGGSVEVFLDAVAAAHSILRCEGPSPSALEAMRFLPEGEHTVHVTLVGEGTSCAALTVRAVPEIIYANYPADPHLKEYGAYDWAYLRRIGILGSVNVIIGSPQCADLDAWPKQGRRLIEQAGVPGLRGPAPSVEACRAAWSEAAGMTDPRFSGIIIDEFYPSLADRFPVWIEALKKTLEGRPGRWIYPYIAGDPQGLEPFVAPLAASRACRFAYERYLREQPTEAAARAHLEEKLRGDVQALETAVPGVRKKLVVVLGLLCGPPETLNVDPAVSFKVFMDMQFHLLANDPAMDGLHGVEEYLVSYADEEYLRWASKLYRHYWIEGRTDRLSSDPYTLAHIRNPDFEEGLEGWSVKAAGPDTVATRSLDGLGWLEGRWPRGRKGDAFLWTKRCAERPNVISQPVRELQPGRVYSLKMYAGDYLELTRPQRLAVSVRIEGVDMIPDKCFQAVFPSCYDHHIEKYGERSTYFNFFRRIFRARSVAAELVISDWASDTGPAGPGQAGDRGGPAGQELLYNFVEVEPYLTEEPCLTGD